MPIQSIEAAISVNHFIEENQQNSCFLRIIFQFHQQSMAFRPAPKTPHIAPLFSPSPSLVSNSEKYHLRAPLSAGYDSSLQLPSCANHKRRKGAFAVSLQQGEVVYFCLRCMQMASNQGFRGVKTEEFYRSISGITFKQWYEEQQTKKRNLELQHYLQNLKTSYQQVSSLRQKLDCSMHDMLNSKNICQLFQTFQNQIQRLKIRFLEEFSQHQHRSLRIYEEVVCKVEWVHEDLQNMISRACRQHQKLLRDTKDTFEVTMSLMNQTLQQKSSSIVFISDEFDSWSKQNWLSSNELNMKYLQRFHGIWENLMLDRSISKISMEKSSGNDISPNVSKIIQELSTSHTLA